MVIKNLIYREELMQDDKWKTYAYIGGSIAAVGLSYLIYKKFIQTPDPEKVPIPFRKHVYRSIE